VEVPASERDAILAQIADGVVVASPDGQIVYANIAAERLYGVPLRQARLGHTTVGAASADGTYHLSAAGGEPLAAAALPLVRAVRHGETVPDARWRIRRPDDTEVVVQGSAAPVVLTDGSRLGSVLVLRDVTAQYDLARHKDEFLGSISHDLKNPLTTIMGTAYLLERELSASGSVPAEQLRSGLATIQRSVARITAQLEEVLDELGDVARRDATQPASFERQPIDIVALTRQVVADYARSDDRNPIQLETANETLYGQWDGARLLRVLGNLIGNAAKYSPVGGSITVAVRHEAAAETVADPVGTAGWAVLVVTDHGVGIPASDLPHVFKRFWRGGHGTGLIAGTGIGLADVRQEVARHGGAVTVESEEGAGSAFTVRLPVQPPPRDERLT